jgi:hypothetical protein
VNAAHGAEGGRQPPFLHKYPAQSGHLPQTLPKQPFSQI